MKPSGSELIQGQWALTGCKALGHMSASQRSMCVGRREDLLGHGGDRRSTQFQEPKLALEETLADAAVSSAWSMAGRRPRLPPQAREHAPPASGFAGLSDSRRSRRAPPARHRSRHPRGRSSWAVVQAQHRGASLHDRQNPVDRGDVGHQNRWPELFDHQIKPAALQNPDVGDRLLRIRPSAR